MNEINLRSDFVTNISDTRHGLHETRNRARKERGADFGLTEPNQSAAPSRLQAWCPSSHQGIHELTALAKVRRIKGPSGNSPDIITRLKATRIGKFYASHLKQIPFLRSLLYWAWRNAYPAYANFSVHFRNNYAMRWRPLISLGEFVNNKGIPVTGLADAALIETPAPKVFPATDQDYLVPPHECYRFPAVYVAQIGNGIIYGATNLVLKESAVICHDLYDFKRDYTGEELHGRNLIDPRKKRIRCLLHDEAPEALSVGAVFVDACAYNYAHWLTEVLPRIAAFCAAEQFKGIPVVINDGLHKNIMESLFLVVGPEREIITLPIGRALQVDLLYLTSVAGYVPFERRDKNLDNHSHGKFSLRAFDLIRNQVSSFLEKLPRHAWPQKIYLRRISGGRKVTNSEELEQMLIAKGFTIIESERLTFLQQTQLFSHATVVIGSSGAALANILFAPTNAKIFILISKYPNTSYWYWQNIACASGKTVRYFFGEITQGVKGIHADFKVDLKNISKVLNEEL